MKKVLALCLTLVMMFGLATTAFAVVSPSGDNKYTVKSYIVSMVTGDVSYQWYKVVPDGDTIKLIVDEKYIDSFVKWEIIGDYEIISGTLTDTVIVIRPLEDVEVYAYVNSEIKEGPVDDSPESPDTASPVAGIVVVMALAAAAAVVSKKQLSK